MLCIFKYNYFKCTHSSTIFFLPLLSLHLAMNLQNQLHEAWRYSIDETHQHPPCYQPFTSHLSIPSTKVPMTFSLHILTWLNLRVNATTLGAFINFSFVVHAQDVSSWNRQTNFQLRAICFLHEACFLHVMHINIWSLKKMNSEQYAFPLHRKSLQFLFTIQGMAHDFLWIPMQDGYLESLINVCFTIWMLIIRPFFFFLYSYHLCGGKYQNAKYNKWSV